MEKNTVWAIVLSTLVLVVFAVLQPVLFGTDSGAEAQAEDVSVSETITAEEPVQPAKSEENKSAVEFEEQIDEGMIAEEHITIKTNNVKVEFTNRGGDVISYELLNYKDGSKNVQMADNISEMNRAFSLSFGGPENQIINDLFNVEKIDDYTLLFYKPYTIKNEDGTTSNFTLKKQYNFKPDDYLFRLDVMIEGDESLKSLNIKNEAYTLRTSPQIGPYYNRKADKYENRTFMTYNGKKTKKKMLGDNASYVFDDLLTWTGVTGKYFSLLVAPANIESIDKSTYSTAMEVENYANAQLKISRNPILDNYTKDSYYIYAGPRTEDCMEIYTNAADNNWSVANLYLDECTQTSGFFSWLEKALKWIMEILYKVIPNWGVSIILMTIILKLALFPLTKKSSVATLKMQALQPKMTDIQNRYKNNPDKMNREMAKLYEETGYNPMSGCLPLLIQFPLLIAMFNLFNNYFEFRGAMFIPGWIPDLSVGDSVCALKFNLPFLGNQIRILPIVYLVSQLVYGKFTSATTGGAGSGMQKVMMYVMPILFFFIFYNAPSGLLLYWTISNVFTLVQQIIINNIMKKKREEMGLSKK